MPAQIIQTQENNIAVVNLGGVEKKISTALIDDVKVGDFVVIHVGFALTKLNEVEAKKTLTLFADMNKLK